MRSSFVNNHVKMVNCTVNVVGLTCECLYVDGAKANT